jgi:RHS repeat-associated protein
MTISTSVHSNAFNFMSFMQGGVDPRTGQYTFSISLPDVKTNDLRGPGVPLALAYNPLNTLDSGFGHGWNLQLSQYTPGNQVLSLSTGETFKVTGSDSGSGQLVMKEKKLDSFHFYKESDTRYRVMHKSGLVEVLEVRGSAQSQVALPVEIHAPEGHKVTLGYETFSGTHQLLSWIKDDSGQTLLTVKRESVLVEILLHPFSAPDGGPLARFVMVLGGSDRYVTQISLPTENLASWRFGYELKNGHLCIKTVDTPTGGREEMFYQDNGHQFPAGSGRTALPRVTRHLTTPGFGQPAIDVRYTYPQEKNFLGFGLSLSWTDDGLDNLYKHIGNYEYHSTEALWLNNQAVRTTERTFNQFHLLTREATTQNNKVQSVETAYYLTPDVPFEQQPKYCQLAKQTRTIWSLTDNPNRRRSETVSYTYDNFGNLLVQTQANGVVETSTWYPAATDPEGFVRHLKDKTVTPATSSNGQAPTLRTSYTYKSLPPLASSPLANWLTVETEVLARMAGSNATELERTVFEYTNDPASAFLHGRVRRQTVTLNQKATLTDYEYSKLDSPELKESVLQVVETLTGFDHQPSGRNVQKKITLQHSILNGEPLLNRDDNDVEIRYAYDALQRVIRETVAPGTEYEAYRRYEYFLCATAGEQAEQWMFDVKQVKTCTRFDGLNRAIYEERDDADNPAPGSPPRQTYAAGYDSFGNLVKETEFDWMGATALALTTEYEFDDWGQQRCVTGPEGVKTFEETDPIGTEASLGPIQRSWRQGAGASPQVSGVTETWLNLFEKPTRTERFDLAQQRVSLHQYFYDGLGRTHKEIVGFGDVQRTTLYGYDAFDRLVENTLPDEAVVQRSFAPHSREDLPTRISVNDILLGTQEFDGLDRRIKAVTGGREQVFDYAPGQSQPKAVITPSGEVIEYQYVPQLGSEPVLRRLPRIDLKGEFDEATYEYDVKNARLVWCQEQGIALTREYYSTGELKSEKRTVVDGEYTMDYRYSRLGRLLGYTDVLRQEQSYRYDAMGRLEHTQLGTTSSTFTYDSLGRTASITTRDTAGGQSVGITLGYDEFDRETLREFDLNGVKQQLTQVYNDVDGLTQRALKEGTVVLRDETYGYDLRGRLTNYTCEGTQPPVDPYNKAISRQVFSFSELDNLRIVITTFADGNNQAKYTYDTVDPAQLRKVTNTHADYPTEILLDYSTDGHLILDEAKRTLEYDVLGRLISVSALPGESPDSYSYDPLDTLAGVNDNGGQEQRFYQDGNLANQIKGANSSTFIRGDDVVLAELKAGADPKSLLLASDMKNSVQSEVSRAGRKDVVYSPYGHRADDASVSSQLGYNGERREGKTGRYLLGNGYRAFSPVLMRFNSPDSWSPFGDGGMNAYVYSEGDSINNVDPSGHVPWGVSLTGFLNWLSKPFKATTASAGANRIPKYLVQRSKSSPETLHTIKGKHVGRMKNVVKVHERKVGIESKNAADSYQKSNAGHESYTGYLKDGKLRSVQNLNRAQELLDDVKKANDFVQKNVGKAGITKRSENIIKGISHTVELEDAKKVKALHDQYKLQKVARFERKSNEVRDPRVKRHYLGDGNS